LELNMDRLAYSPAQAARLLGIDDDHIRRAIADGALVARAIGRRSLIWRDDLKAWFRTRAPTKSSRVRDNEQHEACHG
jgi:excisionase family DNA binding protein